VYAPNTQYRKDSFPVNPASGNIFPWLSGVANHYESYKFRKLAFKYHARCPTSTAGVVGMAFDFDVQDEPPRNQMAALMMKDKASSNAWDCFELEVDLSGDRYPTRYCSVGATGADASQLVVGDPKTWNVGRLTCFQEGVSITSQIGYLEVVYVVDLITPSNPEYIGGYMVTGGTMASNLLVGTTAAVDYSGIVPVVAVSDSQLTFNTHYTGVVVMEIRGTVLNATNFSIGFNTFRSGNAGVLFYGANAAGTAVYIAFWIEAFTGDYMTPAITSATTVTNCNWWFTGICPTAQVDGNL
jgi:hypothetical protein